VQRHNTFCQKSIDENMEMLDFKEYIMKHNFLDWIAIILIIIGAINWGLVGLFSFNIVMFLFSGLPLLEHLIYIIIGLAGIYKLFTLGKCCRAPCPPKDE